jgi:hypothetical protein
MVGDLFGYEPPKTPGQMLTDLLDAVRWKTHKVPASAVEFLESVKARADAADGYMTWDTQTRIKEIYKEVF